ncbi:MAG TPA: lipase maturation factor family protein, partial [Gemmatimonadales bacterium]|nr:lipase maturation factor family protein [Gemmatimonadales bacterium]
QWDALLLEAGLLAALWAPPGLRLSSDSSAPSAAVRWLLVFLLFKLMFLSGATKLLSGDPTWRQLTALDYHFETQPLPTPPAWYAHQLPPGLHRGAVLGMFAIELGAPWLLWLPRRLRSPRRAAVVALVLLQAGIALTGNYGFFNLLAVVLCLPALDDDCLRRVVPAGLPPVATWRWSVGQIVIAVVAGGLSGLAGWAELSATRPGGWGIPIPPRWAEAALGAVAPVRSFNGYGLFRVMTTERPELVVEVSRDGSEWVEYPFRYQPGPVHEPPRFVAPYQPRLDWQLWFAALDPGSSAPWLAALTDRLRQGSPAVVRLMGRPPFAGPPRFVRLAHYRYRFTTRAERSRRGDWWARELVGYLPELR